VIRFSKALFAVLLMANLSCVGAESGIAQAKARILVLNMRLSGGQHQVLSARVVDSAVALKQLRVKGAAINYTVTDERNAPLLVGSMKDPRVLRGPMPPATQGEIGHSTSMLDEADYVLRVPYSSNARYLKFLPAETTTTPAAAVGNGSDDSNNSAVRSEASKDGASQVIDLQQYLPKN
jgi:hypothetical protein